MTIDEHALLCVEEYSYSDVNDWKMTLKFDALDVGLVRVFHNKKLDLFVTTVDNGDDVRVWQLKLSNNPADYLFSIGEDENLGASAFIQPKYGDGGIYDQHGIMNFFVHSANDLGFFEECEAMYSYSLDGRTALGAEEIKEKLLEIGLEYDPDGDSLIEEE